MHTERSNEAVLPPGDGVELRTHGLGERFPGPSQRALIFAGSTFVGDAADPLYVLGEVTQRVLSPFGHTVQILKETAGAQNPRFVADGRADVGATQAGTAANAWHARGEFAGEPERKNLRAIATICRPWWVAVAVAKETGITSLAQIREQRPALRMSLGGDADEILGHFGLSREALREFGGQEVRRGSWADVDLIIANLYLANTPSGRRWLEATEKGAFRFLDLPEPLIQQLTADGDGEAGFIPHGYLPGVDRDVATISRPYLVVYTGEDAPEERVYQLAEAYDRHRRFFRETPVHFSYDPEVVGLQGGLPLHPGALAYYRERGYPTDG